MAKRRGKRAVHGNVRDRLRASALGTVELAIELWTPRAGKSEAVEYAWMIYGDVVEKIDSGQPVTVQGWRISEWVNVEPHRLYTVDADGRVFTC